MAKSTNLKLNLTPEENISQTIFDDWRQSIDGYNGLQASNFEIIDTAYGKLNSDVNQVYEALNGKQDVISDLQAIRTGAGKGATAVQPGDLDNVAFSGSYGDLVGQPTKLSDFEDDMGYLTAINAEMIEEALGFMPGEGTSDFSGNYNDLTNKPDLTIYAQSANLARVATSGNYNDLKNTPSIPTIPSNISYFNNDSGYLTDITKAQVIRALGYIPGHGDGTSDFTGDYNDLINKPDQEIETLNNLVDGVLEDLGLNDATEEEYPNENIHPSTKQEIITNKALTNIILDDLCLDAALDEAYPKEDESYKTGVKVQSVSDATDILYDQLGLNDYSEEYYPNENEDPLKIKDKLVVANPENILEDQELEALQIGSTTYKIKQVLANQEKITDTPETLDNLTIGNSQYLMERPIKAKLNVAPEFENLQWELKYIKGPSEFTTEYIWYQGEHIYYSKGLIHREFDKNTLTWKDKKWTGIMENTQYGRSAFFNGTNVVRIGDKTVCLYSGSLPEESYSYIQFYLLDSDTDTWTRIYASGGNVSINTNTFYGGQYVWTDGTNTYYSDSRRNYQLVLNEQNNIVFTNKTWNGLTSFYGNDVWTNGGKIYYSNGSTQYELNIETSTWSRKTWTGLTNFTGRYVFQLNNISYCYRDVSQYYCLDAENSSWSVKSGWSTPAENNYMFNKHPMFQDGEKYYISQGSIQYIYNENSDVWETTDLPGICRLDGAYIWTDGDTIYYSKVNKQYKLNEETDTWEKMEWNSSGITSGFSSVWWLPVTGNIDQNYYINGGYIYCYYNNYSYRLNKNTNTWENSYSRTVSNPECIWSDGVNTYYSTYTSQYRWDPYQATWRSFGSDSWRPWISQNDFNDDKINYLEGDHIWTDGYNYYFYNWKFIRGTINWVYMPQWRWLQGNNSTNINYNSCPYTERTRFWSNGENTYYVEPIGGATFYNLYKLDSLSYTWIRIGYNTYWPFVSTNESFNSRKIWKYKDEIWYYSDTAGAYKLKKPKKVRI